MNFEEACSEMEYIINHMKPEDRLKIPEDVIKFFTLNKDNSYQVNLDYTKDLSEEELKEETEAFIKIIYECYLKDASKDNIEELKETIKEHKEKAELIEYKKESFFTKLFKKITNFFRKE